MAGFAASGALAAGQERAPADDSKGPAQAESAPKSATAPEGLSLDDLIPQGAVDDPEGWAAQGAAEQEQSAPMDSDPGMALADGGVEVEAGAPDVSAAAPFDIDTALEELAIAAPEPLPADPDLPSFADIAAPDLVELPELAAVEVGDALTLAFPVEADLFPERTQFIARFRMLSAIETLDSSADTVPQLAARARSDEELLRQMLRTYGYYDAEVVRQLSGGRRGFADEDENDAQRPADTEASVRFDILPSVRYRFGRIELGALDRLPDPDGGTLRAAFGIKPGDPLYADRILAQQGVLRLALGENGYPFAELGEPALLINHARDEGDLTLPVDPRGKFAFGEVVSDDPAFLSSRHLQRIARFAPGDIFAASLQSDLRRAILATGLVSSVVITPRETVAPADGQPGTVALDVALERAPLRTISGAIGYGSQDGFKLEAAWEHRNLFPPEGALRLRGILGTREQLASVTFRRRNFRARDQVLTLDAYISDIETEAVDARTVALRGAFERVSNLLFQKPLSWQIGAEMLITDERNRLVRIAPGASVPRQAYAIAGLFGSATLDTSNDLLDPTEGFRLTGFLAPEYSRSEGADSYYLRAQGDASVYREFGNVVLAARIRGATINGAEAGAIAPSRRLYAGGGGSVRGYGFQAIGPRDELGNPLGGASLVEAAIEARIGTGLLDGAVEVVPFVDAGSVALAATPDFSEIRYGAGVGVRYKTSFGPIRVDVGVPLNPGEFDAPVVVYVSLGQAF